MTLDGYGEFPKYPGWDYVPKDADEFWNELWASQYDLVDTVIFGRSSYEGHAKVHALAKRKPEDPYYMFDYSRFLEKSKKIVITHRKLELDWANSRIMAGDLAEIVKELKQEPGKNIILEGGPSLVHEFMLRGLIDEYRILLMPVILGKGPFYWGTMANQQTLRLVSVKAMKYGELVLRYESVHDYDSSK